MLQCSFFLMTVLRAFVASLTAQWTLATEEVLQKWLHWSQLVDVHRRRWTRRCHLVVKTRAGVVRGTPRRHGMSGKGLRG